MNNNLTSNQARWGMTIHMAALAGLLMPLALVLGPLLVWMLKKGDDDFFDVQGKKAINFQLTILLIAFLMFLLAAVIRPLLAPAFMVLLTGIVFAIIAGIMIRKEGDFDYPFSLHLIK
ncbi:MAG: DUF4870 domain-containing protein [Cocleimonas sp.]|nr:DUF4870 domain-containing protein [Cocleimonas sp.]